MPGTGIEPGLLEHEVFCCFRVGYGRFGEGFAGSRFGRRKAGIPCRPGPCDPIKGARKGCEVDDWTRNSAFGDIGELEHVCSMLEECADGPLDPGCLDYITGEKSTLVDRLNTQAKETERLVESKRPGLYQRTWIAGVFRSLFCLLDEVTEEPSLLPLVLSDFALNLHKVFIAAHEVFTPVNLEKMIAEAEKAGKERGVREAKEVRSILSRKAVGHREDQLQRVAFLDWAKGRLLSGDSPTDINQVQALQGFNPSWSQRNLDVLKRWAKEAGFNLKAGRPRKI